MCMDIQRWQEVLLREGQINTFHTAERVDDKNHPVARKDIMSHHTKQTLLTVTGWRGGVPMHVFSPCAQGFVPMCPDTLRAPIIHVPRLSACVCLCPPSFPTCPFAHVSL